ncbi:MAG: hypothetical protein ACR2P2_01090 [Nakamurella sp.]
MTVTQLQRYRITMVADLLDRLAQDYLRRGQTGDLAYRAAAAASELRNHSHSPDADRPRLCHLLTRIQTLSAELPAYLDVPQAGELRELADQASHQLGCK